MSFSKIYKFTSKSASFCFNVLNPLKAPQDTQMLFYNVGVNNLMFTDWCGCRWRWTWHKYFGKKSCVSLLHLTRHNQKYHVIHDIPNNFTFWIMNYVMYWGIITTMLFLCPIQLRRCMYTIEQKYLTKPLLFL